MSIEERIATLLHEHRESMSQNTAWDECVECSHQGQPWARHVASVLVAELGLVEEREFGYGDDENYRYTTAWERVE